MSDALKNAKLDEGLYAVGDFRGVEERVSNGTTYHKVKVLVGDHVIKFDIKPEQAVVLSDAPKNHRILVRYYSFTGKFGVNNVCLDIVA